MFSFLSVLYFEDLGIHLVQDRERDVNIKTYITLSLLSIECTILLICIYQLYRFFKHGRLHLKKLTHILIALQMIVCMLQAIKISDVYEEFLGETTFAFCSLIYLVVLLFWFDFHQKLKQGSGILFLKQPAFAICIVLYVILYTSAFAVAEFLLLDSQQALKLPSYVAWWHLAFFTGTMIACLCVTIAISNTTRGLYQTVRVRFFKKTAKILSVICCCFILRFLGTLLFIFLHHKPESVPKGWDTPMGFVIIYLFDRIIPVVVFMVLMRKVPGAVPVKPGGSGVIVGAGSGSFGSLYTPLLSDEA